MYERVGGHGIRVSQLLRWVALLNLVVLGLHGWAHTSLPVPLSFTQALIVYGVIVPGPLVAFALSWRRPTAAAAVLLVSSAIGLPFGVLHHFVWVNPDHVSRIPAASGRALFRVTAALLVPLELVAMVVAALTLL